MSDGSPALLPIVGGAAVNCAVALSRLGAPAAYFGVLSTDAIGTRISEFLQAEEVDISLVQRNPRPSTLALARVLPDGTHFDLYDENSAGRSFTVEQLPLLPDTTQALVFGGISLVHPPAADAFEAMLADAAHKLTWLDLNIRPAVITKSGPYRARLERMIEHAMIIKVSDEDLDWFGSLPELRADQLLLHTHGAAGVTARLGDWHHRFSAPQVEVRDTVGAGDIFNAGVLASLADENMLCPPSNINKSTLSAAIAHGINAASYSVGHPGAHAPRRKNL